MVQSPMGRSPYDADFLNDLLRWFLIALEIAEVMQRIVHHTM